MRDTPTEFDLLEFQVFFSQLIDRLVKVGGTAHGRFNQGQAEDVVGGFVLEQFLEGIFDLATGQRLRGVIAGGFLPVAACQAVDEGSLLVAAQRLVAGLVEVVDALAGAVIVDAAFGHKPGTVEQVAAGLATAVVASLVIVFTCLIGFRLNLKQGFGGKKTAIGQQGFINGTELVDG